MPAASRTPGKRDVPLAFQIADTPVLRDLVAGVTPRWLVADGVRGAVAVKSVVTDATIDRYWELLRYPGNRAATLQRFRHGYGSVSPGELAAVATPTLILWGREDRFIPVASAAYFAKYLPHSRTVIYDGVGHLPMEGSARCKRRRSGEVCRPAGEITSSHTLIPTQQGIPPSTSQPRRSAR